MTTRKDTPCKLLVYAPMIGRGGISRFAQKLVDAWSKDKAMKITVIAQQADEFGHKMDWGKNKLITLPQLSAHPKLFDALTAALPKFYAVLKEEIKNNRPDVIYLPMGWWTMRGTDWNVDGIPVVAFIGDFAMDYLSEFQESDDFIPYRAEALQLSKNVNVLIMPSVHQVQYAKHYGFEDVRMIYNSVFIPQKFDPFYEEGMRVTEKYKLPRNGYTLAFHAANHKDPICILKGQHNARRISSAVMPLVIAGLETGDYRPDQPPANHYAAEVQRTILKSSATIGKDLFILGEIPEEDIGGLYAGASVAVVASRSEGGLSGAVWEAIMSRTPLIFSDFPVFTERLKADVHGYCFPVGDDLQLGITLARVYNHYPQALDLANNAHATFMSNWSEVAVQYTRIFKELAGK